MDNEKIAAVLEDAAALLEKGWTRNKLYRPVFGRGHAYCAVGAIRQAVWHQRSEMEQPCVAGTPESYEVVAVLAEHLCPGTPITFKEHHIYSWNDSSDRTKQEVLDTFHLVAKKALGVEA